VDENVQPANSLMGIKPKAPAPAAPAAAPRPAGEERAAATAISEADDGPPTLNLQSAPDAAVSGAPRTV
jgi:hypothetical protein